MSLFDQGQMLESRLRTVAVLHALGQTIDDQAHEQGLVLLVLDFLHLDHHSAIEQLVEVHRIARVEHAPFDTQGQAGQSRHQRATVFLFELFAHFFGADHLIELGDHVGEGRPGIAATPPGVVQQIVLCAMNVPAFGFVRFNDRLFDN